MKVNSIVVVSIVCIIFSLYVLNRMRSMAAEVPPGHLFSVLRPGSYVGRGNYAPTDHYPNGLKTKLRMNVQKANDGLQTIVQIDAYDAVTGKHAYSGVRNASFDYKPNHGRNVFKNSKSFIGRELVSSSHGKVVSSSPDQLVISSAGSWHTSSHEHDIINTIKREGNKLYATFDNSGIIPFLHSHTMQEEYTYEER